MHKELTEHCRRVVQTATNSTEDKAKYEKLLSSAQEHIKLFIEAGVKEIKELKELN